MIDLDKLMQLKLQHLAYEQTIALPSDVRTGRKSTVQRLLATLPQNFWKPSAPKLVAVAGVALILSLQSFSPAESKADQTLPPLSVEIIQASMAEMPGGMTASGRLLPRNEAIVASDLSGFRIAKLLADEGDVVRAGQVLAVLDDSLLRSQIDQARASVAQRQASAEMAREQAARVAGLDDSGVISNEDIRSRRIGAKVASATAQATQSELEGLLVRQSHMIIRAPVSGMVLERTAKLGDAAMVGMSLFRIADGGQMELHAELAEADIGKVGVGDPVQVTLSSGEVLEGAVRLLDSRVNAETGMVNARILLPSHKAARQGAFARANFTKATAVAMSVPESAVQFDPDGAFIQTVDAASKIRRIRVKTGRRASGLVEVVSGLAANSRVVLSGGAFALDGDKVQIAAAARTGQTLRSVAK